MMIARSRLVSRFITSSSKRFISSSRLVSKSKPGGPFSIAFDIDGVLVRGGKPIPGGKFA